MISQFLQNQMYMFYKLYFYNKPFMFCNWFSINPILRGYQGNSYIVLFYFINIIWEMLLNTRPLIVCLIPHPNMAAIWESCYHDPFRAKNPYKQETSNNFLMVCLDSSSYIKTDLKSKMADMIEVLKIANTSSYWPGSFTLLVC